MAKKGSIARVSRINLTDEIKDLEKLIDDECVIYAVDGFRLAASFSEQNQLVLIFTKS